MLQFRTLENSETGAGTIFRLLYNSYKVLLDVKPELTESYLQNWTVTDNLTYDNPDTIGRFTLFSYLNDFLIGFISWDPRRLPEEGIIGHNCILPAHRGYGYGRDQIRKVMDILHSGSVKLISVTTGDHPFFLPAQKNYLSCGFTEHCRSNSVNAGDINLIHYEYKAEFK